MIARALTCLTLAAAVTADIWLYACERSKASTPGCTAGQMYCTGPHINVTSADGIVSYWDHDAGAEKKCALCRTDLDAMPVCDAAVQTWTAELLSTDAKSVVPMTDRTRLDTRRQGNAGGSSNGGVSAAAGATAPPAPFVTFPSSGVTLTLGTFSGMEGWLDIPESVFVRFPTTLLGLTATVPSFHTAAGFNILYSCNSRGLFATPVGFKGCDIFLFQYHCPPCTVLDGSLRVALLSMSYPVWYPITCGPVFKLVDDDALVEHPFTTFIAEIQDGERALVELPSAVEFMFWALRGKNVMCNTLLNEADCNANTANCEWSDSVCKPLACPRTTPSTGPFARCQVCTDDESPFVPSVLFP